jgi:hypothetical protein
MEIYTRIQGVKGSRIPVKKLFRTPGGYRGRLKL